MSFLGTPPPWLLTKAAYGGLESLPVQRLRRAYLHLLHSRTALMRQFLSNRFVFLAHHRSSLAHFTTSSGGLKRKEKRKYGLNPWCLFLDAVLSFEEITPIKVRISIKFRHWMPADLEIWEFEKFCLFGLKDPFPGTFRNPILIEDPFTTLIWMSPFSPSPGDLPCITIKFFENILSHYMTMIISPSYDYLVKIFDEVVLCPCPSVHVQRPSAVNLL